MKYSRAFEKLGLPKYFKFGIELEADNVRTKGKNGLYTGESAKYITDHNWHMATKNEEILVSKGGAELVSPILHDTKQDWKNISDICKHIKKFPGENGNKVVTNNKCGLHIHFDADCLLKDPNRIKNFMRLYAESEELLYKMCNDKNNPMRKEAINKNFKGFNMISALWRKGMAAPTGKKILEQIQNGTLKVSYKKFNKFRMLASKYKLDERRYAGINLTNIGNSKKNTIEFRMANGTLNPDIIKQNIFLYASLIDTSIKITDYPKIYENKLNAFYNTNISEKQKVENFLNLIMENTEDRQIFIDRWKSVKDSAVFAKNENKGFAQNRFKRDQFKKIAQRTPGHTIHSTYLHIKEMLSRTNDKGAVEYDR